MPVRTLSTILTSTLTKLRDEGEAKVVPPHTRLQDRTAIAVSVPCLSTQSTSHGNKKLSKTRNSDTSAKCLWRARGLRLVTQVHCDEREKQVALNAHWLAAPNAPQKSCSWRAMPVLRAKPHCCCHETHHTRAPAILQHATAPMTPQQTCSGNLWHAESIHEPNTTDDQVSQRRERSFLNSNTQGGSSTPLRICRTTSHLGHDAENHVRIPWCRLLWSRL